MRKFFLIQFFLFYGICFSQQQFELEEIFVSGPVDSKINFVIMGDGYVEGEMSKFIEDAKNASDYFFSIPPFNTYKKLFNSYAIKVISNESGANHPGTSSDNDCRVDSHPVLEVDNYFGATFDSYGIHRLLTITNHSAAYNILADKFPSYDQVLILVNTSYYGGAGGALAVASLNQASNELVAHELGHSFSKLADEYWAGDNYAGEGINMTQETDPTSVKWKNWIDINDIGIYQHCCTEVSKTWHRPHQDCKMRYLNSPFCSVCIEGTVKRIHSLASPLETFSPSNQDRIDITQPTTLNFEVTLAEIIPNELSVNWILNGTSINNLDSSISVDSNDLQHGNNQLKVVVEDNSSFLKLDNHLHSDEVIWQLYNEVADSDNDGIGDNVDQCESTSQGATVDMNGCQIFYLNPDNFSISKTEKCIGKNSITLDFESSHNYNISVQGAVNTVGSSVGERWDLTDLSAGNYSICITVDGVNASEFERCFEVNISEPDPLGVYAVADESNEMVTYTLSGGDVYNIVHNGETSQTSKSNYTVRLKKGVNNIKISTGIECQGIFEQNYFNSERVSFAPNPFNQSLSIYVGGDDDQVLVEIFSSEGRLIKSESCSLGNISRSIELFTGDFKQGSYFVKVTGDSVNQSFIAIKE